MNLDEDGMDLMVALGSCSCSWVTCVWLILVLMFVVDLVVKSWKNSTWAVLQWEEEVKCERESEMGRMGVGL